MKMKPLCVLALLILMGTAVFGADSWKEKLRNELPLLGHRNWVVVADSAYPLQTAPGVETIYANADQLDVVSGVLAELAKTKHVKPSIYTDAEMKFVAEANATGVSAYRDALAKILSDHPVQVLPHEQIIGKIDEAGKTFKILIIKTTMTKPYTSVFIQLDCAYWSASAERELREAMKAVH
jgi:RbsD / FucU transport protein family